MKSRTLLRIAPLVFALAVVGLWWALGANLGWTKTRVALERVDEVTGIGYVEWEQRFVPGVDFLLAGVALSAAALGVIIFVQIKKPKTS